MILITLDIDWAPDFIIKKVDEMLTEKNVKATWFVTHKSAYLKTLSKNRNYELGIHPNFMSDSTQGNSIEEILSNLKKIVPTAKSVRTHRLFQSTQILETFHKYDKIFLNFCQPFLSILFLIDFNSIVSDPDGDQLTIMTVPPSSGETLNTLFGGTLSLIGGLLYEYTPPESNPDADFMKTDLRLFAQCLKCNLLWSPSVFVGLQ